MKNKCKRTCDNPWKLSFQLIERITNNFSEELGRGASGQVFKGVLEDGEEVAVKMLRFMGNINDQRFENEFEILKRLEHPNIVRLVGFCDEAQEVCIEHDGKPTVCQRIHRALCLEYMPNGSLGKLLHGENLDKNWRIRYRMIKGICEGLEYLQQGLEFPILHLDLKPDNILLNKEMVPKISDFGLSRPIGEENSKKTSSPLGTCGYLPPEFINYQVISKEYDIYSLGVIITKIITGITGYSDVADMGAQELVEHVHENWKKCLQEIPRYESLEVDCKQVKRCIEIARRCMEKDRHKRPTIKDIVSQLDEIEMENCKLDSPLQLGEGLTIVRVPSQEFGSEFFKIDDSSASYMRSEELSIGENARPIRRLPLSISVEKVLPQGPSSDITHPQRRWVEFCGAWARHNAMLMRQQRSPGTGPGWPGLGSASAHLAHPKHKPKLMTDARALFLCDGCKELGYGPRYARDFGGGGHSSVLHTRCARADDPLFDLQTLVHPLFGYGKQFEFRFLHEPPHPVQGRLCDACGEATRGFVYHSLEEGLDLHPCCASLPDRIIQDGRAFDLHRRASRPCALCPDNEGQRRWFWAYRCYVDGEVIDLHVACLKETARRSWEACYRNQDVGDGALNVDSMLENMFSSTFGDIAGTLASFITALVFGSLIVKM